MAGQQMAGHYGLGRMVRHGYDRLIDFYGTIALIGPQHAKKPAYFDRYAEIDIVLI